MPGRYAVIIGINYRNFPDTMDQEAKSRAGINPLNYAEADAVDMVALLKNDGYVVRELVGLAATRTGIIAALKEQSRKAGPEGLLLVHYSGHGALDPDDRELAYLLPVDCDPEQMASTAIPLDSIARYHLGNTQAALVILDCCHSGYAVGLRSGDKDVVLKSEAQEFSRQAGQTFKRVLGRVTIAACAGQQLARERRDLKHGVLTYYILDHWRSSSESVDDLSMYRYLAKQMPTKGVPAPVRGGTPQQGIIELRPARAHEPTPSVLRLSPSERATLFRLILEIVQTPTDFLDLTFYVNLEFQANSQDADLRSMIRSLINQAEANKRIPELREAIDQFRADQQFNNPTPNRADDIGSASGTQGDTLDGSTSETHTASEANIHVRRGNDYYDYYANHLNDQALAEYNRAIELDPKIAEAYNGLGFVHYMQNNYERALAEYNRAIELNPKLAEAYAGRGWVYTKQNDYKRALAEYNRAIELDPKIAETYNGLGLVHYMQNDYKRALAEYNRAIELNPKLAWAYNNRGLVHYMQNDYIRALADFDQAIELNPEFKEAHAGRKMVYAKLAQQ